MNIQLPRDVSFTTRDIEQGAQFVDQSMAFCEQWRDVVLSLPLESFSSLAAHHGPFPLLRSLSLNLNEGIISGMQTVTIRGAPLLREVTLKNFPLLGTDLDWEQLTTLKITAHEAAPGILALQRCTNLVDLEFSLIVHGSASTAIPPFPLPSLKSLLTTGQSVIPYIIAPQLERFDISGPGFGGMSPLTESLRALLERSACPLQRLSFRMPPKVTTAELRAFLHAAALVVDLQLTLAFADGLAELITVLQSAEVLPRLMVLRIMDDTKTDVFGPLLDTLRARRGQVVGRATLDTFSLILQNDADAAARVPSSTVMAEFGALADDGLHVCINNGTGAPLMDR